MTTKVMITAPPDTPDREDHGIWARARKLTRWRRAGSGTVSFFRHSRQTSSIIKPVANPAGRVRSDRAAVSSAQCRLRSGRYLSEDLPALVGTLTEATASARIITTRGVTRLGETVKEIRLAAAIIIHDDQVLIVRRSKKEGFLPMVWNVPCGKIDIGEDSVDAALRELREETGIDGEVIRFVGYLTFSSTFGGRTMRNVQLNYLVRPSARSDFPPKVTLPENDQDFRWVHTRMSRIGFLPTNATLSVSMNIISQRYIRRYS